MTFVYENLKIYFLKDTSDELMIQFLVGLYIIMMEATSSGIQYIK